MEDRDKQICIPYVAQEDPNSFELLRVWIANKGQHCSIRVGVWDDPAAWGIVLADLAQHIANSYEQDKGDEVNVILQRIKQAFDAEIDLPTDAPQGGTLDERKVSE